MPAVCTVKGDLFTFGRASHGMLGHRGHQDEPVSRLVEAMVGNTVIRVLGCHRHTVVDRVGGGALHFWVWRQWEAGPRRATD